MEDRYRVGEERENEEQGGQEGEKVRMIKYKWWECRKRQGMRQRNVFSIYKFYMIVPDCSLFTYRYNHTLTKSKVTMSTSHS